MPAQIGIFKRVLHIPFPAVNTRLDARMAALLSTPNFAHQRLKRSVVSWLALTQSAAVLRCLGQLQRVLNAAARLGTNTDKYDRGLSSLLHDQLHWLNVPKRIEYKLAVMNHRCLWDKAPTYLSDYCIPVTAVSSRHLCSVNHHQRTIPRCRRITFGHRAFSVAGLMVWNSLPTEFHNLSVGFDVFRRTVKTILFARY